MNLPPSHIRRTPDEIINEHDDMDSVGHMFRAKSWLDYYDRNKQFSVLLYICIEARYAIEYLLFEELVISTGANLSREEYEKCLRSPTKLSKMIDNLCPDYEKLKLFTEAVVKLEPQAPKLNHWAPNKLMKSWGIFSKFLHWVGSRNKTSQNDEWKKLSVEKISSEVNSIWDKMCSGQSGILHPDQMHSEINDIWVKYRDGKITLETAIFEMNYLKPILHAKYA